MSQFDLFPVFLITLFFINLPYSYSYPSYQDCVPSLCNSSTIKHPFQFSGRDCGQSGLIDCPNNHTTLFTPADQIDANNWFRVLGSITELSYTNQSISIAHNALFGNCLQQLGDTNAYNYLIRSPNIFHLSDNYTVGTILKCSNEGIQNQPTNLQQVQCLDCRTSNSSCFFSPNQVYVHGCPAYTIIIPADKKYNITAEKNLRQFLQKGFEIRWNTNHTCHSCEATGGICYSSSPTYFDFAVCICRDGSHRYNCSDGELLHSEGEPLHNEQNKRREPLHNEQNKRRFTAAICGISFGIFATATMIVIFIYQRVNGKRREQRDEEAEDIRAYMDPHDSRPPSVENFLHGASPTKYSYAQIKRYTNNFADMLGQGGFGTVYKGKLPNECLVAVKILDKSKHSRKQFMNEVATIGTIHHLHLVRLLGYCFQGSKRALVYEYMAKGSLEKYIHGDDQTILDWKQLYSIAVGTARGIAYLHNGCRSRILHCDIKPHNVLLDANFFPKVGDFGLAKLTDREESHVSMTGARGTPGYVAPEVWSRNYGPLGDKSDVYSYGMLVMEMVGGRKNFDMQASRSSKFYYPQWAFKQVKMGEFTTLRKGNIADEEDENIAKKLSQVALWCIQYYPSQRPAMNKVIEMLDGSVEITILPHPFPVEIETSI